MLDTCISDCFTQLSITPRCIEHELCVTVEAQNEKLGHLPGNLTKNMFLRDTKKNKYYLLTLKHTQTVDLKVLSQMLKKKEGSITLRFASEEQLTSKLHVTRGSVSPLCIVKDTANEVKFILDETLMAEEKTYINCHPLRCDQTVSLLPAELVKITEAYHHEPILINGDELSTLSMEAAKKKENLVQGNAANNKKAMTTETKGGKETKSKEGLSVTKGGNFADWYTEVITKSGLIDYYDISGCYILRPYSYEMWEMVQQFLDTKFKSLGVKNCYFPIFVSKDKLTREKDHVEGFAPEVAWVTKYGESDLKEHIAIRPTSETIMYPSFKNWIRSHRDLPLKLNQWNNVVRWEFKNPTPFIRTREFLWQEGHTAYAKKADADEEVYQILEFYKQAYEEVLAVPMIKGIKTEKEKFAGGDYTTTIEGFIPSTGRGIQAATSHHLGQNFGKMFHIQFENEEGEQAIPYQNSWGFTTRSLGIMIMVHGDDKGLVIPPAVAPMQVVIIPIPFKDKDEVNALHAKCEEIKVALTKEGIRCDKDIRSTYTPGWKYNHWELRGIPIRMELGPKDLVKNSVRIVRRDTNEKMDILINEQFPETIQNLLATIQKDMLKKATEERNNSIRRITEWKDFVPALQENCLVLTPFCNETEWEETVKERSREESLALLGMDDEADNTAVSLAAKTLCMPLEENAFPMPPTMKCFISGKPAKCWVLWGRSY